MATDPLWAITSYFNPLKSSRRLQNYRIFRTRLTIPLLTVECSADGTFDLNYSDADVYLQSHGDVLWQKERLLNVSLQRLPDDCLAVAWLDCDVIFERDDWPQRALTELEDFTLIQPFDHTLWLERDFLPSNAEAHAKGTRRPSLAFQYVHREVTPTMLRNWNYPGTQLPLADGYAWISRLDFIRKRGLYDASIIGGGTREFAYAAMGELNSLLTTRPRNVHQRNHLLAWARPLAEASGGSIQYIKGGIYHLWHGSPEGRRYGIRHHDFQRFNFDPRTDIVAAPGEGWSWSSKKPEMHDWVRSYFETRKEDG
jgi:hypothetical protein